MAIDRPVIVDDSGAGTDGTIGDAAWVEDLLDRIDAAIDGADADVRTVPLGGTGAATLTDKGVLYGNGTSAIGATAVGTAGQVLTSNGSGNAPTFQAAAGGGATIQTTTSTGTQNDFAQTAAGRLLLFANNATALTITGFAAGTDGDEIVVVSVGAGQVNFSHQAGGSTAANRLINFVSSGVTPLAAGAGIATFRYSATAARWRLTQHEQGAWISPTYAGGDYTASSGTWTVDSGDVFTLKFFLRGRQLFVLFNLQTTSVSATPFALRIAMFGYTLTSALAGSFVYYENSTWGVGTLIVSAAATTITLAKDGGGVALWTTETNAKLVEGSCILEIT